MGDTFFRKYSNDTGALMMSNEGVIMKTISLAVLISFVFFSVSFADVTKKDRLVIKDLINKGQHEEALKKTLSYHQESKTSSGQRGVRLSYALFDWEEFGDKYPPALDALIKVKEQDKEALLSGKGNAQNFHDLLAINEHLNNEQETLELFIELEKKYPEEAVKYYDIAENLLVKNQRFYLCSKYIPDPLGRYNKLQGNRDSNLRLVKNNPEIGIPGYLTFIDDHFTNGVVNLVTILTATDRKEEALETQSMALEYFNPLPTKPIL